MHTQSSFLARITALLGLSLPLCLLACSASFSAGGADASSGEDSGDGGGIIIVGEGGSQDGTMPVDSGVVDAHHDAHHDGATDSGADADSGPVDSGTMDADSGCAAGDLLCSGACVANDKPNCGACGNDCSNLAHVSGPTSCTAGARAFPMTSCATGWADCDGNAANGCEADTTQSPNCGGCSIKCAGGTPVCDGTSCISGCSGSKPTLCNGTTCTDTTSDPQNCNTCNNVCPAGPSNSQPTCASSVCGYQCNSGYSGCGSACVNEQTDPTHCGSCGNACMGPANSTAKCTTGMCGFTCNPTFTQCLDGTCDDVNTDPTHCGSSCTDCNTTSPPPANGSDVCSTGTCDFTCATGFARCEAGWECLALPGAGAYVQAGSGFSPPNCGTAASPCPTIQDGIEFAKQQGLPVVYVADGTYPESLSVTAPMTIQGGWTFAGGGWSRDCPLNPASTKVVAPSGSQTAVSINASPVTLDTMSITNNNVAAASQTLFGVSVAALDAADLRNVMIDVAGGGAGLPGGAGKDAGSTPTSCSAGTGAVGSTRGAAQGAPAGTWSAAGYIPGISAAGLIGGDGQNGTVAPAQGQPGGLTCVSDEVCPNIKQDPSCTANPSSSCGTGGTNGCGGLGSGGGVGGFAGGASVGIFAWGATVTLDGPPGKVTAGAGGNGGNGGPPGTHGTGSSGTAGTPGPQACQSCVVHGSGSLAFCQAQQCGTGGGAGNAGGTGGNGGSGGQGGGGSGGDSHCYVAGGGGSVTTTWPASYCSTGAAGLGGNQGGGSSQGASGSASEHN